jgi:hypothetical protein
MNNLLYTQAHIRDIVDTEIYDTCREQITGEINLNLCIKLYVKIEVYIWDQTINAMRDIVFDQIKKDLNDGKY